jgi:hypothetical protein
MYLKEGTAGAEMRQGVRQGNLDNSAVGVCSVGLSQQI